MGTRPPHRDLYDGQLDEGIVVRESVEFVFLAICTVLVLVSIGVLGLRISASEIPFQPMVYSLSTFALVHACYVLGWRRGLVLFGLTMGISFAFEYVGVHTGVVFGRYHYTRELGPEILDTVPLVILPAYFLVLYPGYLMGNLLTRGHPVARHTALPAVLWASLLTAMIASAWDLTLEPAMVHDAKAWVWEEVGPYFGIPFHNFAGWIATTFVIALGYRLLEKRVPLRPLGRVRPIVMALPVISYAGLCISDVLLADPVGTRVIALFAMGIPLVAASVRLLEPR